MLPITKSDRVLSWAILVGVIALVYRRVKRLESIDRSLDQRMYRFVVGAGEAGKDLILRTEDWISRA